MGNTTTKYKVMLLAYKDIEERVKNIITKYSVCNIKDKNALNRLLKERTDYQGSGRGFNLNDRIGIYLGWFEEQIKLKLEEGYILDIIEVHKSYGDTREELLKALDIEYGDDIIVLDIEEL